VTLHYTYRVYIAIANRLYFIPSQLSPAPFLTAHNPVLLAEQVFDRNFYVLVGKKVGGLHEGKCAKNKFCQCPRTESNRQPRHY
jgi:hypothetical protein